MTKEMSPSVATQRIIFLDYLRIFAFSSVLAGHKFYATLVALSINENLHITLRFIIKLFLPFIYGGGAGVVVFFLTSGYIISHVLMSEDPVEFAIKRVFRIYPLYIVACFAQIALTEVVFPDLKTFVLQLSLFGDFFGTPWALLGVEWTLRVEIVFYVFMLFLKLFRILNEYQKILPAALILSTIGLGLLPAFPSFPGFTFGYFTMYAPFLFMGVIFYLREKKIVSLGFLMFFSGLVLFQYFYLTSKYQPSWLNQHFSALSVLLFAAAWNVRQYMRLNVIVLLFSDLTYSVYLFHNWLWGPIENLINKLPKSIFPPSFLIILMLFIVCFALNRSLERGGIHLGRVIVKKYRQLYVKQIA